MKATQMFSVLLAATLMLSVTGCSKEDVEKAGDSVKDAAKSVGEAAGDAADKASDMASDAADSASETMADAGEAIGDAVDSAGEMADDAMDAAGEMVDDVSDAAGDTADEAEKSAKDAASDADSAYNRMRSMVDNRPDWVVSRQRAWGVPITVFVNKETGEPLRIVNRSGNRPSHEGAAAGGPALRRLRNVPQHG